MANICPGNNHIKGTGIEDPNKLRIFTNVL